MIGFLFKMPLFAFFCWMAVDARGWWGLPAMLSLFFVATFWKYALYQNFKNISFAGYFKALQS